MLDETWLSIVLGFHEISGRHAQWPLSSVNRALSLTMGSKQTLIAKQLSAQTILQDELRQTFSECIGQSINEAADNLQFSRYLYGLPAPYGRELESIESTLRSLAERLDALVIAFAQAGEDARVTSQPSKSADNSKILGFPSNRSIDQAA